MKRAAMVLTPSGAASWVIGVDRTLVFRLDRDGTFAATTLHDGDDAAEAAGRAWCERGEIEGDITDIQFPGAEVNRAWAMLTGEPA